MSGNAGFSINGQGLSAENVAHYLIDDMQAQTATIINEIKLAAALVGKIPYLVFRERGAGDQNDDGIYSRVDPVAYADHLHALAPPGCWLYAGNEFGSGELAKQDDWTNRFVARCAQFGRKPLVHNQAVLNPVSGIVGWRQLASSTRAAVQAGGGVGPHLYWRGDPVSELARTGRNAFSVLDELRQIHGEGLTILCSEFAFDANLNGTGYVGQLSDETYAAQLTRAAALAWEYQAFVQFYGLFPVGSQWVKFNLWFNETIKPLIAAWNRSADMTLQVPAPTTGGIDGRLSKLPGDFVNVRAQPYASARDVGDLKLNDVVVFYPDALADGWIYVQPFNGAPGWVSLQAGAVAFTPTPAPPTPDESTITIPLRVYNQMYAAAQLFVQQRQAHE